MKVAAHVIAYDVNRFINPMLRNVAPWVDKIYVAYPPRPFDYIPSSREQRRNQTKISDINLLGLPCPVEIVEGDWPKEEQTRNACLDRAKAEGFDWLITQDADEFYPESSWKQLRQALANGSDADCFRTTWYQFWKSSDYVLVLRDGSIKTANIGFALRCKPSLRFERRRVTNAATMPILDCPCYHYGYALTDQEMLNKVTQWSHANDFLTRPAGSKENGRGGAPTPGISIRQIHPTGHEPSGFRCINPISLRSSRCPSSSLS